MARVSRPKDVETKEYIPHQNRYVYRRLGIDLEMV